MPGVSDDRAVRSGRAGCQGLERYPSPHPLPARCEAFGGPTAAQWLLDGVLPLPLRYRGKGDVFKAISEAVAGTGGGMITQDRLTGSRQFMNMDQFQRFGQSEYPQKTHAVYCIERVISLLCYTLCVFHGAQRWNSFRNDGLKAWPRAQCGPLSLHAYMRSNQNN